MDDEITGDQVADAADEEMNKLFATDEEIEYDPNKGAEIKSNETQEDDSEDDSETDIDDQDDSDDDDTSEEGDSDQDDSDEEDDLDDSDEDDDDVEQSEDDSDLDEDDEDDEDRTEDDEFDDDDEGDTQDGDGSESESEDDEDLDGDLPKGFSKADVLKLSKLNKERRQTISDQKDVIKGLEEELKKIKTAKVVDIKNHPQIQEGKDKLEKGIENSIATLPLDDKVMDVLHNRWGKYLQMSANASNLSGFRERRDALNGIKLQIAKDLGYVEKSTKSLDPTVDEEAINIANQAIRPFTDHADEFNDLTELAVELKDKADKGALAMGYQQYADAVAETDELTSAIELITPKQIQRDPYAVSSLAAKAIKKPGDKVRAANIAAILRGLRHGVEVFSQEEMDAHRKNGDDIVAIQDKQEKKLRAHVEKYIPRIHQLLILGGDIDEGLELLAKSREEADKKQLDKKVIKKNIRTKKRRAPKKKKVVESKSLEDHEKEIDDLFS